jgi:hypothetical protein
MKSQEACGILMETVQNRCEHGTTSRLWPGQGGRDKPRAWPEAVGPGPGPNSEAHRKRAQHPAHSLTG